MKQIERILAEIHRLKNELEGYSAQEVLDYIESYINIISREQPSSSDLDEAAEEWCKTNNKGVALCGDGKSHYLADGVDAFKAGAEWQKEQMLKDAVEADVNTYIDLAAGKSWAEFVVRMPTKDLGDKVRLVIIKEDKK